MGPFPAEWSDTIHVPDIVDMRDKRDVGISTAGQAQLAGYGFLELDERIHIGTGSGKHVVRPEDHPHVQPVIPYGALDELEAGAVIKFFIDNRVPRDGDRTPRIR